MMNEGQIPNEQQNSDIFKNDIDNAYSQSAYALAALRALIQQKMAMPRPAFIPFYQGFYWLFCMTAPLQGPSRELEIIVQIQNWFDKRNIDQQRVKEGAALFKKWSEILDATGIHTLSK